VEIITREISENQGHTNVDVLMGGAQIGTISIQDSPSEAAHRAIRQLHAKGVQDLVIISEDQPTSVRKTSRQR
jgi:cation transport ATPase